MSKYNKRKLEKIFRSCVQDKTKKKKKFSSFQNHVDYKLTFHTFCFKTTQKLEYYIFQIHSCMILNMQIHCPLSSMISLFESFIIT
jgi:hypothetical protein